MKLRAEIGEKILIVRLVFFVPVSFSQPQLAVVGDFGLRRGQFERRIPGAAIRRIETRIPAAQDGKTPR